MANEELNTLESIKKAGRREFLDKGFKSASLRQIVKNAGVTTGAFYGYFSSKEALYNSIVEPHAAAVMGMFMRAQTQFADLPADEQPEHMGVESANCVSSMLDYMYENYEDFKILVCCSDGTSYENFIDNMVEIEVDYTYKFINVLRNLGNDVPDMDRQLCHIISSGMFNGIFEVIVHDMPQNKAKIYVRQLREFYLAGWKKIIGF